MYSLRNLPRDCELGPATRIADAPVMADDEDLSPGTSPSVYSSRFRPALVQYFRFKLSDPQEVDDLVQEVFVRVTARHRGGEIENIGGYLFQTAASVLSDRHRRRTVRHADAHIEFDNDRHSGTDFDAARILEAKQLLQLAINALELLPEKTRNIFILRRVEGQAYKDIARQFGITVSAVEKHMARAIRAVATARGFSA